MRVFLISPYHSGSHRAWADGYVASTQHDVHIVSLEGRFWKWRMAGAAVTLSNMVEDLVGEVGQPDVILANDMMELDSFLGLSRRFLKDPKVVLYMHENQLTYPVSAKANPDLSYGFRNWKSMVVADEIWFNSEFHRTEVTAALPRLLNNFPDHKHSDMVERTLSRSKVMHIGVTLVPVGPKTDPPLIVWNHRWEYDKNPQALLAALNSVVDLPWRLALCGANFKNPPANFVSDQEQFGDRVIQYGYCDRDEYLGLLGEASISLSTSNHEFFGISVVEAISSGAAPLLPTRLSYPEIIPDEFHDVALYGDDEDLARRLREYLSRPTEIEEAIAGLAESMQAYGWDTIAPHYDSALSQLVNS